MSLNLNQVTIAGNLTRDVEVKFLANEQCVANFGVAINRRYKGKDGEKKEETTFVDITAWGRTGELAGQYLKKGSPVYIEGRLTQESWDDKDGKKRTKTKITADNIQFLAGRPTSDPAASEAQAQRPARPAPSPAPADDETPF